MIMKSPLLLLSSVVISIFITGCSKEQKENDLTKFNIKGDVKSLIEESHYAIVRNGKIEKDKSRGFFKSILEFNKEGNFEEAIYYDFDGSIFEESTYEYDEEGDLVKEISLDPAGVYLKSTYEYKYDQAGNQVEKIVYNTDGSKNDLYTYEYDEARNLVKEIRYSPDGSIFEESTYEYDEAGNLVKEIVHDIPFDFKSTYEYDDKGNLVKRFDYESEGLLIRWTNERKETYDYDEEGSIVKIISYESDGSIKKKVTYEFEYDMEKNWTRWVLFKDDVATEIVERQIEYY